MSDLERSRIRKEAADAVTARTPHDSDQATDTALRRYLGIAMFDALRRRKDTRRSRGPGEGDAGRRGQQP